MVSVPAQTQSDRTILRRVLLLTFIAFVAFVAMTEVWELVIDHLQARPAVPEPFASKLDAALSSGRCDTMFIGSSRFFHGIDPATFDAETARLGVPTHSYNLSYDALNFFELRFILDHLLADPRQHLKYILIEPSLRIRLMHGLEQSQRAITLHDFNESSYVAKLVMHGNVDWRRKLLWLWEQGSITALRLSNIGALTNHYVRLQEPAPKLADLVGPEGKGYLSLEVDSAHKHPVTEAGIKEMQEQQIADEKSGQARELNQFEIDQLTDIQQQAAKYGVKVVMLTPPTATADIYGEFSAVIRATEKQNLNVPLLSFTDPVTFYDLYRPEGFADPDHLARPSSELWTLHIADSFAKFVAEGKP